ncbi:BatA and WFA domain-containing protein [Blastopirellula sp. J2-11]|uniref:vWA domain-containing protein n=1 Tax=Blastopirellula sp. J2-11 TaxID=2943192 RepID=UPI0021C9C879|nr:BatA and WFA domain-containing protein [Blastopirellula sp. J2-11]UUO04358.1 BatA and WFA domain-containing protein [Blastopirellula sp. J2-11]
MTFAAPWIFGLGLLAVAAPVLIHWLTRPRPVVMRLSTLRFVREAVQSRSAANRLRDWIILALRCVAILLLTAAFAKPQWGDPALIVDDDGDAVRVVVLDVSQSMAAAAGNIPGIERARTIAERYLQYRSGLRTNLIIAGAQPHAVFENVSTNFEALREELSHTETRPERMDVDAALELAARQLAPLNAEDQRRRELIVISDFQRSGWGAANFDAIAPETKIQLESTAGEKTPDNWAILSAVCQPMGARQDRVLLTVRVGNYSPTSRNLTVEAEISDAAYRLSGVCEPQDEALLTQEIPIQMSGWIAGQVRLVDMEDTIPADDWRPIVARLRGEPRYVLITQQTEQGTSSSHILACALAPEAELDSASSRLHRVPPRLLDNQSLTNADLIAINDCGKLSPEHIGVLARQLTRGRSLLYVASDPIDAVNLAQLVEESQLQLSVRFAPPAAGTERHDLRLVTFDSPRPPLANFGDSLAALVEPLRFGGGLSMQGGSLINPAADDSIRAMYSDDTPAIVVASTDSGGTLAIVNADLTSSNIWKTGALVPILDELVQELLATDSGSETYLCGEKLVAQVDTGRPADTLRIVRGSDLQSETDESLGRLLDEGNAVLWQWDAPDAQDVYQIQDNRETLFAAAIAIPAAEADLSTLPADVVLDRLVTGHEVHFSAQDASRALTHDLWKWFAVGVLVCMLVEVAMLMVFRT